MSELKNKIDETLKVIKKVTTENYEVGIILGTGLGGLVSEIKIEHEIDYDQLPHFPISTVEFLERLKEKMLLLCRVAFISTKVTRCSKLLIL